MRCVNSFSWRFRTGPIAAFAVDAVAARAVGLVDVVAALHGGDLLGVGLRLEARLGQAERSAELVEPVEGDEQDDEDDRQEADPAGVGRLADDLAARSGVRSTVRIDGGAVNRSTGATRRRPRRQALLGSLPSGWRPGVSVIGAPRRSAGVGHASDAARSAFAAG